MRMPPKPEFCEIQVRVTPRSSRNRIEAAGDEFKIWVTAPPVDGEANAAVCLTVAKALGVAKTRVTVIAGETSRNKTLRIDNLSREEVLFRLT